MHRMGFMPLFTKSWPRARHPQLSKAQTLLNIIKLLLFRLLFLEDDSTFLCIGDTKEPLKQTN